MRTLYIRTKFLYLGGLGGLVNASADIVPEIKRRVRLPWAVKSIQRELCDMEAAPFTLKVRMLNAEVMETLLYGVCVTWTLYGCV